MPFGGGVHIVPVEITRGLAIEGTQDAFVAGISPRSGRLGNKKMARAPCVEQRHGVGKMAHRVVIQRQAELLRQKLDSYRAIGKSAKEIGQWR